MGRKGVLKAKDVEIVDKKTGEVIQGTWYILAPKHVDVSFCKFFMPVLEELFKDETISKNAIRLLLYMISKLSFNSLEVVISPKIACKELGIHRDTFYRWRKILLEKGLIARKDGFKDVYLIRPYSVIRGAMHKIDDRQLSLFYESAQAI